MSKSIARGLVGAGAILLAILLTGCSDDPSPTPSVGDGPPSSRHAGADACFHLGPGKHSHAGANACYSDLTPWRVPDALRLDSAGSGG